MLWYLGYASFDSFITALLSCFIVIPSSYARLSLLLTCRVFAFISSYNSPLGFQSRCCVTVAILLNAAETLIGSLGVETHHS